MRFILAKSEFVFQNILPDGSNSMSNFVKYTTNKQSQQIITKLTGRQINSGHLNEIYIFNIGSR